MSRPRYILSLIGAQGMGKTSLAKRWVKAYRGRKIILSKNSDWPDAVFPLAAYEDPRALEDWVRVNITGHSRGPCPLSRIGPHPDCPHRPQHAKLIGWDGALLVADDCDDYIPHHSGPSAWNPAWYRNRHLHLDLIAIGHMTQAMNKSLLGMSHEIWVFPMEENGTLRYLSKIPSIGDLGVAKIPTQKGHALRVQKYPRRRITLVDTFNNRVLRDYTRRAA